MRNYQALEPLGFLSDSDIRKIRGVLTLHESDRMNEPVWGYCTLQNQSIALQYIDHKSATSLFQKGDESSAPFRFPRSHESIAKYFEKLLDKLNMDISQYTVDYLEIFNASDKPLGLAFIIHQFDKDAKNTLRLLVDQIQSIAAQKKLSQTILDMELSFKTSLKERDHQIALLEQNLQNLKSKNSLLERQMQYQKNHDSATNMLNRQGLENALEASFNSRAIIDGNAYLSVIFIQITNGERIQARIGCDGFDTLLSLLEQKISKNTPHIHYYARISTTELALTTIVPSFDEHFLPNLCRQLSEVARQGMFYRDQEVHLHVFMGVANSYHTDNSTDLINNAFHAAVSCKESGATVSTFTQADQDEQKEFNQLEHYLLQAVRNDDLILYFQPKIDLKNDKWIGAEVLLRWKHPVLGDISNEALIHMAEQNGLIVEVGYFVLRSAIDKASEWIEIAPDFTLSVNVSAKQICSARFADRVLEILENNELPSTNLELELTESCLVSNFEVAYQNIVRLKGHGVRFALDDFGTGYASFSYLRKLPFDCIKIDKEFLSNILHNAQDKAILRSIINIAKKLNKQVVVEGVETSEQHRFVATESCDVAQGYYYAKPMPRDIFEAHLEKQYPPPKQFIIR